MGIHVPVTLQHLFERISEPVYGLFHGTDPLPRRTHALLWDCYASGQMSDADLEREIAADPAFAAFLSARERQFH